MRRRDISNSPPRGGSTLQPSSGELQNCAAMASDMSRDTHTPQTLRELNDLRPAPLTGHDSVSLTLVHTGSSS
jgi:hypothetical protein